MAIYQYHIPGRCEDTYPKQNEVDLIIHPSQESLNIIRTKDAEIILILATLGY
jgi:hypothetical protein